MNTNQDTIESHGSTHVSTAVVNPLAAKPVVPRGNRAFTKTARQDATQPHKRAEIPLMINDPLATKPVARHNKDDDKIITIDGSQEYTADELTARMSDLFDEDDSEEDSQPIVNQHFNASTRPIARMSPRRNEDDNERGDNCNDSRCYDAYDDSRYDDSCYDDSRCYDTYDDSRYDSDEYLYGGFTDDWEDYYDSVYI